VLRCWRERIPEIAMPWFSGKLCTLGYLSPRFMRLLRPALERRDHARWRELEGAVDAGQRHDRDHAEQREQREIAQRRRDPGKRGGDQPEAVAD